ncbi:MAG: glycosyltransferase family 2 protein [Alphaproteobacteria bacterium]
MTNCESQARVRADPGDPAPANVSVVILTFNSEASIAATIQAARRVSADIHVVDSHSTDGTREIARSLGAAVVEHPFDSYGAQRNWAIDNLPLTGAWELHLDADERLTDPLADAIRAALRAPPPDIVGYYMPRLVHFLGRPIRRGGMYPIWHMRLFRRGQGRCEDRRYDQHFYVDGATGKLAHPFIDDIRMGLAEFLARHARWAEAEVEEQMSPSPGHVIGGRMLGGPVARKRSLRGLYDRLPLFWRAFALFFYRYVLRLGFLDGREGLIFFVLQTLVFRFLVDARLFERQKQADAAK